MVRFNIVDHLAKNIIVGLKKIHYKPNKHCNLLTMEHKLISENFTLVPTNNEYQLIINNQHVVLYKCIDDVYDAQ